MKIKNVSTMAKNLIEYLKLEAGQLNQETMQINNHRNLYQVISILYANDLLTKQVKELFNPFEDYLSMANKNIRMGNSDFHRLSAAVTSLKLILQGLSETIDANIPSDKTTTVSIKLPDERAFDIFSDTIRELNVTLGALLSDGQINEKIEIEAFDNGSLWIQIVTSTVAGVNLIGLVVWASYAVLNKHIEYRRYVEGLRKIKISNDNLEAIQNAMATELQNMVDLEARNIAKEKSLKDDAEILVKLRVTIKQLSGLLEKGMEFHPGDKADPETLKEFPLIGDIKKLESKTKLIAHSDNKSPIES